jgi:hypothetical protein
MYVGYIRVCGVSPEKKWLYLGEGKKSFRRARRNKRETCRQSI